jgi:thioredoxin-related protein
VPQLLIVVALVVVAVAVAAVLQRRDVDPPEQGPSWAVPVQLDRADFARPDAPWLVVLFSSSTCLACEGTWEKVQVLEAPAVAVQRLDAVDERALHQRYGVDAVPMVLLADASGEVRRSFVGEPTATDLWAALAELREPGSVPPGCGDHDGTHPPEP